MWLGCIERSAGFEVQEANKSCGIEVFQDIHRSSGHLVFRF